ncbi:MAG: amino acid-binding protein [Chrysiogenales bacterium]|nr:MAG: amino acid-binding protein [Chrysiogenales bacterium]
MTITQVSIAVENAPGSLYRATTILEKEQINIKGIMAATQLAPVQVNMIVDDPDRAVKVLRMNGFTVSTKEVIAAITPDHPGGLNAVLRPLIESSVNIDAVYPFIYLKNGEAVLILEVDKIKEAKEILKKNWVRTYGSEIYKS